MCLANISSVLGYLFRWTYVKLCCGICSYRQKKRDAEAEANEGDKDQTTNNEQQQMSQDNMRASSAQENSADNKPRISEDTEDFDNEMNDKDDIENASVPLTVTIFVVTGYILCGAILFHITDDFGYVESAYFCFVTLTTIGK